MKPAAFVTLLATVTSLGTASAAWQRLPNTGARPVDLSSQAMPDTAVVSSSGVTKASNLLSEEISDMVGLAGGHSEAVIKLSGQQIIDMVSFINAGAEGKIAIAGSPNGTEWSNLGQEIFGADKRFVGISFGGSQVKFVKLSFDLSHGGNISSFKAVGNLTTGDFSVGNSTSNLAAGVGGAHVIYANPAPSNLGEKDYDMNVLRFGKTAEKYRTVIYDLGVARRVETFSAIFSARPVRVQAFAFESLPEQKDWRGKLTLDPAIFDTMKPAATAEDSRGTGMVKLVPTMAVKARYIALRFEPNYQVASNGDIWSNFVAFAAAPYLQAGSVLGLGDSSQTVSGDTGAGFTTFDTCIMSQNGTGNGDFGNATGNGNGENGNGNDGNANGEGNGSGGSTDGAAQYNAGPAGWMTGSPFSYTGGRSGGGTGNGPFGNNATGNGSPTRPQRPIVLQPVIVVAPDDTPTSPP